ncbi:dethiobiotin synthase [Candidatus Woesearchaeota archaeon]|nr:dethiobiotin synthase [Candidatus Woesearchaeota archaeon]
MGKGIFIAGTDTGVGKTVIACGLAKILLDNKKNVAVYKPVQCGNLLKGRIASPDLALVKKLSGISNECLFNDYSFKFASSPHLAAELENRKVRPKMIRSHYEELCRMFDYVIIEGAGGLLVPLTRHYSVLDLIKDLKSEVIVVARSGLGTINHTSLTLRALYQNGVKVKGVIVNYYKGGKIEEDNKKVIQNFSKAELAGVVPFSKDLGSLAKNFEKFLDLDKIL